MSTETRVAKLRKALSSGQLEKVRELIPDKGKGAQEVLVYTYACILETNSAGLSILFDRFDDDELRTIHSSLESIGALGTLVALQELQKIFDERIVAGDDRLTASEFVNERPEARRIDREYEAQSKEMTHKLLEFCEKHLEELAAG